MISKLVIIDLDLTLYSMAEFLRAHPFSPLTWGHALWRWSPQAADQAIDQAWENCKSQIHDRIAKFDDLAAQSACEILWLTANPLTEVKLSSFQAHHRTASSYPLSKVNWAKAQQLDRAFAVLGDRQSDALLAQALGAHFFGYSISHPAQRLTDQRYTHELLKLWPQSALQASAAHLKTQEIQT
ncbi:MAG TPA: hypothetical protein PLZ57_06980 [Pseudobdellovibrionaceae bacterium]|mgnify:CR=1 FL=1|nr:hypothetical protein [Pseudobdellovibrionaceae bacterium]